MILPMCLLPSMLWIPPAPLWSPPPSVLVLDAASVTGPEALRQSGFAVTSLQGVSNVRLSEQVGDYDGVIVRSANQIDRGMMTRSPRLAVIGRAGSGVDNIDVEAATELGVVVVNAPTGNAAAVAEHTLGLMLSVARKIPRAHGSMGRGEWAKSALQGASLAGKTLGIVGMGAIGKEVAKLAAAFGMHVLAAPRRRTGAEGPLCASSSSSSPMSVTGVGEAQSLEELLARSDYVSVHVPLTAETAGLLGPDELALMKETAVVINTARGGVVEEQALLKCLQSGSLGGAALDVFCREALPLDGHVAELCNLDSVVCTPHIGASTREAGDLVLQEVCASVAAALAGTLPAAAMVSGDPDTGRLQRARMRLE